MSNQRMTITLERVLQEITEQELFDFAYDWTDVGVYTKAYMQKFFIDWWKLNEIAFETIDLFKYHLRRYWLSSIDNINRLLQIDVRQLELVGQTRKRNLERKGTSAFSDTPNQNLANTSNKYLSNTTDNTDQADETEQLINNPTLALKQVKNNLINLTTDWANSFQDLFLTHITIKRGIAKYGLFS